MTARISDIVPCPRCGVRIAVTLFATLDGERMPREVDAILDGSFERTTCAGCNAAFQPEHRMLYTHATARLWIVMYPVSARADYPDIEAEFNVLVEHHLAGACGRDVRPRLVFGHHGLREALRAARDALDPTLLECTKLLTYQYSLSRLFPRGPSELVYERGDDPTQLGFGMRELTTGERLGELWIPASLLRETRKQLPELTVSHPELFEGPYISALRYVYRAPASE